MEQRKGTKSAEAFLVRLDGVRSSRDILLQGVALAGFPLLRIITANTLKALDIHVH
jgi:hypothetical protein